MDANTIDELYGQHLQSLMKRADVALAAAEFDALVISAGTPPLLYLDDQDYPFKVNPHFKAWVPITDNPRCVLVYKPGQRPHVLFHQPEDYWHKPAALPDGGWSHCVDITPLADITTASTYWAKLGRVAFIGAPFESGVDRAAVDNADLLARLHFDRAVKNPYELECMRRANALGALGHRAAAAAFHDGASEYTAHLRYLEACAQREEELPYNSIVAYNKNAAVLHYQHLERRPPSTLHSFLVDAGAQFRGYASDITRTYAAAPGRFATLIELVNAAQLRLCDAIISGRDYREVHLSAHRLLGDVLKEIGLTFQGGEDALDSGVTSVFFPHGIGHLLGLQVHDVGGVMSDVSGTEVERPPGHPRLRLTRMLEPGVVVTIEPGIYFIDSLLSAAHADCKRPLIDWEVVEEMRPFGGIRIEDNVVATGSAPENMTRDAFAALSH